MTRTRLAWALVTALALWLKKLLRDEERLNERWCYHGGHTSLSEPADYGYDADVGAVYPEAA